MLVVNGFKHLYLRKTQYYFRQRIPKRLGLREIRLCLHTSSLSVAVIKWHRLQPYILKLKQLVIISRKLDTKTTKERLLSLKDIMTKVLSVGDIDGLIAQLEHGYSDKAHRLNALSGDDLLALSDSFKEHYLYIAQALDNQQRLVRFSEVVASLEEEKWPVLESFSTVIKAMSFIGNDNDDSAEGLENQANQFITTNCRA
ncbi:DUF6538 domain-containing protein [Thalassotalea piscium]